MSISSSSTSANGPPNIFLSTLGPASSNSRNTSNLHSPQTTSPQESPPRSPATGNLNSHNNNTGNGRQQQSSFAHSMNRQISSGSSSSSQMNNHNNNNADGGHFGGSGTKSPSAMDSPAQLSPTSRIETVQHQQHQQHGGSSRNLSRKNSGNDMNSKIAMMEFPPMMSSSSSASASLNLFNSNINNTSTSSTATINNYHNKNNSGRRPSNPMITVHPPLSQLVADEREVIEEDALSRVEHEQRVQRMNLMNITSTSSSSTTIGATSSLSTTRTPDIILESPTRSSNREYTSHGETNNNNNKDSSNQGDLEITTASGGISTSANMGSSSSSSKRPAPIDIVPRPLPHSSPDDLRDAVRSNARVDRPYDVALEYNRLMLFRYALVLGALATPLLYFTPIVGMMMAPPGFLLAYWTQQKARFQHGGDVRACVNRDCTMAVGIVFITIAILIDGFNVIDLVVGGDSSSSKLPTYSATAKDQKTAKTTTTTTTTTTAPLRGLIATPPPPPPPSLVPSTSTDLHDIGTIPPSSSYSHINEEAAHSPFLRKAEIILGALVFFPACLTLRHVFRIRKLVSNPISAHVSYGSGAANQDHDANSRPGGHDHNEAVMEDDEYDGY